MDYMAMHLLMRREKSEWVYEIVIKRIFIYEKNKWVYEVVTKINFINKKYSCM